MVGAGLWTCGDGALGCAGACTATPSIVRFVFGPGLGPALGVGAAGDAGADPDADGGATYTGDSWVGAKPEAAAIGEAGSDAAGIPSIVRCGDDGPDAVGATGDAGVGATGDARAGDATGDAGEVIGAMGVSAVGSTAVIPSIVRAIGDAGPLAARGAAGCAVGGAGAAGPAGAAGAGAAGCAGGGDDAGAVGTGANPPTPGVAGAPGPLAPDIGTTGIPSIVRFGAGLGAAGADSTAAGALAGVGTGDWAVGAEAPTCAIGMPSIVRFGSAGGGAAASGLGIVGRLTRSYPQLPQKRAPGFVGVPHCGQGSAIAPESTSRIAAPARRRIRASAPSSVARASRGVQSRGRRATSASIPRPSCVAAWTSVRPP